jgi:hypothetical protein
VQCLCVWGGGALWRGGRRGAEAEGEREKEAGSKSMGWLLQTTSSDLRTTLVFIWAKILALDRSCQVGGFAVCHTQLAPLLFCVAVEVCQHLHNKTHTG